MVRKWFECGAVEKERRYSPGPREMGEGENPLRGGTFRGKSQAMFRGNGGARELMNEYSSECQRGQGLYGFEARSIEIKVKTT